MSGGSAKVIVTGATAGIVVVVGTVTVFSTPGAVTVDTAPGIVTVSVLTATSAGLAKYPKAPPTIKPPIAAPVYLR
ncbi:MAG: hypothetical protein QXR03_01020 [Candidatus Aenigmatarchaeota archaeon]